MCGLPACVSPRSTTDDADTWFTPRLLAYDARQPPKGFSAASPQSPLRQHPAPPSREAAGAVAAAPTPAKQQHGGQSRGRRPSFVAAIFSRFRGDEPAGDTQPDACDTPTGSRRRRRWSAGAGDTQSPPSPVLLTGLSSSAHAPPRRLSRVTASPQVLPAPPISGLFSSPGPEWTPPAEEQSPSDSANSLGFWRRTLRRYSATRVAPAAEADPCACGGGGSTPDVKRRSASSSPSVLVAPLTPLGGGRGTALRAAARNDSAELGQPPGRFSTHPAEQRLGSRSPDAEQPSRSKSSELGAGVAASPSWALGYDSEDPSAGPVAAPAAAARGSGAAGELRRAAPQRSQHYQQRLQSASAAHSGSAASASSSIFDDSADCRPSTARAAEPPQARGAPQPPQAPSRPAGWAFVTRRSSTGSVQALGPGASGSVSTLPRASSGGSEAFALAAQRQGTSVVWGPDEEFEHGGPTTARQARSCREGGAPGWAHGNRPKRSSLARRSSLTRSSAESDSVASLDVAAGSNSGIRWPPPPGGSVPSPPEDVPAGPRPVRDINAPTAFELSLGRDLTSVFGNGPAAAPPKALSPAPPPPRYSAHGDNTRRAPLETVHSGKPSLRHFQSAHEAMVTQKTSGGAGGGAPHI